MVSMAGSKYFAGDHASEIAPIDVQDCHEENIKPEG
jgi:hypothetical protein